MICLLASSTGLTGEAGEAYKKAENLSFTYDAAKNVFIRQDGPFQVVQPLASNEMYEFSFPDGRRAQLKWIEASAGPREVGVNEGFSTYVLMQNVLDENTMQLVSVLDEFLVDSLTFYPFSPDLPFQ